MFIISELDMDARRMLIDAQAVYQQFRQVRKELRAYAGGMAWKRAGGRDYLFKLRDRRGFGSSLGVRSPETERIHEAFHRRKGELSAREQALRQVLVDRSRLMRAAGLGRVPKTAADLLRVIDHEGLLDGVLTVLGTHALYAYEGMAGVRFDMGLLATGDIDLLFDARRRLRLAGDVRDGGLLGLLKKADRSFELAEKGHFRAVNRQGFMVELVKTAPKNIMKTERMSIGSQESDLVAAETAVFKYLINAPGVKPIVIGEDGLPLRMSAPNPCYFAINKLWVAERRDRDPVKRPRDLAQAIAVARVCIDYLGLDFSEALRLFPGTIREQFERHIDLSKSSPADSFAPGF